MIDVNYTYSFISYVASTQLSQYMLNEVTTSVLQARTLGVVSIVCVVCICVCVSLCVSVSVCVCVCVCRYLRSTELYIIGCVAYNIFYECCYLSKCHRNDKVLCIYHIAQNFGGVKL